MESKNKQALKGRSVIIVGGGLAGLSAALHLQEHGAAITLLERNEYLGGRTASWDKDGMIVESGLHRFLGFFSELPQLLKMGGINPDDILFWEDEIIIMLKGKKRGRFGLAPFFKPLKTLAGFLGNSHLLSISDKLTLTRFFTSGMIDCIRKPEYMDQMSILEYAKNKGISDKLITTIVTPLSAGLFFLPPQRYSSFVFFGIFIPFLPRIYKTRVGAFLGGMTDVMANPLANKIIENGGVVITDSEVTELIIENNAVKGVTADGIDYRADHVILAASIGPAQKLIEESFGTHPWFAPMLSLPIMPSVTIQIELKEPCMDIDRTSFAPETCMAAFSEQSRSTFRHTAGRLSVILSPPEKFLAMQEQEILDYVINDAESIGLKIRNSVVQYRIVVEPAEFYALIPGTEDLRPQQKTPIPGLSLAGDYTKQKYLATMEGAVYSGRLAAETVLEEWSEPS
jgi:15-cis-phytoene desaturase